MNVAWPAFFPDECPPGDAVPAAGRFLRLVRNNPPEPTDFVALRIENPDDRRVADECQACGLSIVVAMDEIHRLQRRVPSQRTKFIASGVLNHDLGRIKPTPSRMSKSHHTWWLPNGVDPSPHFAVVDEKEES